MIPLPELRRAKGDLTHVCAGQEDRSCPRGDADHPHAACTTRLVRAAGKCVAQARLPGMLASTRGCKRERGMGLLHGPTTAAVSPAHTPFKASQARGEAAPSPNHCISRPHRNYSKLPKSHKTPSPTAQATVSCWYLWTARQAEREGLQARPLTAHRSSTGGPGHLLGRQVVPQGMWAHFTSQDPKPSQSPGRGCDHPLPSLQHVPLERRNSDLAAGRQTTDADREAVRTSREAATGQQKPLKLVLAPMLGTPRPPSLGP